MQKPPKLFLATPAYGGMMHFTYVLGMMELNAVLSLQGQVPVVNVIANESLIPRARNMLVANFMKTDCEALVFIDADIGFITADVAHLVASNLDVVAAACPRKCIPTDFVVNAFEEDVKNERFTIVEIGGQSFVEVRHAGTGLMVIRRHVIERMIKECPETAYTCDSRGPEFGNRHYDLFSVGVDPETGRYLSEDWGFCKRWRALGGKVHMHLSGELSHSGMHTFTGSFKASLQPVAK